MFHLDSSRTIPDMVFAGDLLISVCVPPSPSFEKIGVIAGKCSAPSFRVGVVEVEVTLNAFKTISSNVLYYLLAL